MWTFLIWVAAISALAKLAASAIENDRVTRLAKVEADLKLKLVAKIGDPELVRRIVEARSPHVWDESTVDATGAAPSAMPPAAPPEPAVGAEARAKTGGPSVLVGLVAFLIGAAFLVCTFFQGQEELMLPGLLCAAVGLAFLTYATSQQQILHQTRGDLEQQRSG